jgi:hypothetical protein
MESISSATLKLNATQNRNHRMPKAFYMIKTVLKTKRENAEVAMMKEKKGAGIMTSTHPFH